MSPLMSRITQQRRVNAENWDWLSTLFSALGLVITLLPRSWYGDDFTAPFCATISFLIAVFCMFVANTWRAYRD